MSIQIGQREKSVHEVLDSGADARSLNTVDVPSSDSSAEERVFRERLEALLLRVAGKDFASI
jgi:hypothetical protein